MRNLRALAVNPITEWAQAILDFVTAIVAILTLFAGLPILPPEVLAVIASIVVTLNGIIVWLKLLVPAS